MEIHSNLKLNVEDMLWLMRHPVTGETVQFNDNRISLYAGQEGKCAITGEHLEVIHCICYRKSNECKTAETVTVICCFYHPPDMNLSQQQTA